MKIKNRIINYWNKRSDDFAKLRHEELHSYLSDLWLNELTKHLPIDKNCKILDIGTGSGFFPILLTKKGYDIEGIDLSESMIKNANDLSTKHNLSINFKVMDAEKLDYSDESFDIILTRNLTWNLENPQKAYNEWHRVLKKDGLLLNFDANYGQENFSKQAKSLSAHHAHKQVNSNLLNECEKIKDTLSISKVYRPVWDSKILSDIGFKNIKIDNTISKKIYTKQDKFYNPTAMFLISANK